MISKPPSIIRAQHKHPFRYRCTCTVGLALLTLALAGAVPSSSATLTVTNTNDSGAGSLRQAIATANAGDTINFNLPNPSTITLTSSYLEVNKTLTIDGPGQTQLAIDATSQGFGFLLDPGVTVSISGLTVQNALEAGIFGGNASLSFSGITVTGSRNYGGIVVGGGTITLNNCTLSNNQTYDRDGGGNLQVDSASVTVVNSVVSGGRSPFGGGGIANNQGTVTLIGSTVSGNSAIGTFGGGIESAGTMTIINSTISGNTTTENDAGGGAIYASGSLTIINSTITGNSADSGTGGGILDLNGALTIKGTLFANNGVGGNCSSIFGGSGHATSLGYNLSDDTSCESWLSSSTDKNNTPAQLAGGLQNNGGPTQTVALSPGSPAVDAIPVVDCTGANGTKLTTDQRGITRPQGKACDIGAYELAQAVPFSSFHPSLAIDDGKHPGYILTSTFTLGSDSTGLNPATEALTLKVANYSLTLAAGSLHQLWNAAGAPYGYDGTVNGTSVALVLTPLGNNMFSFDAAGNATSFAGVQNPVSVTLSFGGMDAGTGVVKALITTF